MRQRLTSAALRYWLSALLLPLTSLPLMPMAQAATGAWQTSGTGATISQRGTITRSPPLHAASPINGTITLVAWRYQLAAPPPAGLQAYLCAASRCLPLTSQNGSTDAFQNLPASESLYFLWQMPGNGALIPAIRVLSNQVIVNHTCSVQCQ